jgi:hypothetical protein
MAAHYCKMVEQKRLTKSAGSKWMRRPAAAGMAIALAAVSDPIPGQASGILAASMPKPMPKPATTWAL